MKILSGDVGGTHSRLELFEAGGDGLHSLAAAKYNNGRFDSLQQVLQGFLSQHAHGIGLDAACLAVAGPVEAGRCRLTNLDWVLDARELGEAFGFRHCYLLNDFAAIPYGVEALTETDLRCLQAGRPRPGGVKAFVGAGTGLGQALSIAGDTGLKVLASEAGHADFAPGSARQVALLAHLRARLGPVSNEMLLSGRGLVNIYRGLHELGHGSLSSTIDIASPEAPAQISEAARGGDGLAAEAVACFFEMLGSYLGNVALQALPYGGIYLAGGIVPKLVELMDGQALLSAYAGKSGMQEVLQAIPIHLILNEGVARLGAARYALEMME